MATRRDRLTHLTRRFLGSLSPLPLRPADDRWAREHLLPGEERLWQRMPLADRKHAVGVAREVRRSLGERATRPVLAGALLHDVGKVESGLGTLGRSVATVVAAARGRDRVGGWAPEPGLRGRIGRYVQHPERGAALLADAGSDQLTVDWARQHHLAEAAWTLPVAVGRALRDADND